MKIASGNKVIDESTNELQICDGDPDPAQASDFMQDETSPAFVENGFLSFDLDSGDFSVLFTEPINVNSIQLPAMLFFEHFAYVSDKLDIFEVQESVCPSLSCKNNISVSFSLSSSDLNRLKLNDCVCTSAANCWLTINGTFISDMAGNPVNLLPDGVRIDMRYALSFTDDTSSPILDFYDLDMTNFILTLTFNEPVDVSTFNFFGITFQSAESVSVTDTSAYYTLTGGDVLYDSGTKIEIKLSDEEFSQGQM